ncbi:protein disulfide isomerase family protein [bacterium]|nr:protein disulfide isomerase family protein [bacterium]|tara:strand:+ start:2981 stop:3445 length:465 start_codon:yes stop_codon:yes gene_type:complete
MNISGVAGKLFGTRTNKIIGVAVGVLIIVGGYLVYSNYFKVKTGFNANREHGNTEPSKEADLLFFYADWCPHCKTAKPEWDALKKENEGKVINGYSVIYTEYNCVDPSPELEDLMNKYEIKGYPTIKLIKDGQVIDYDAKPTTSTLNQFLTQVL